MASPASDVAVVGGGIVGAATAAVLAEAGARVTLHERTAIAAAASGRNSGVVQHPFDTILVALHRETLAIYRRLAAEQAGAFAIDPAPAGLLLVGNDAGSLERLAADWRAAWPDTRPAVVGGADLRTLEPAIDPALVACRLDVGYPVAPAAATGALAALAERRGARILVGGEARLAVRDGVAVGVELDGRLEPAGAVVVAGGPWTPGLLDPTGRWRPIRPVWGVVAQVELDRPPRHVVEEAGIEIEPPAGPGDDRPATLPGEVAFSLVTAGGATSLGSTFLAGEPDPAAWVAAIRERGARFVPDLAAAPLVGLRSCARPVAADGRPLVGAVPGIERAFVAAGHGPWGISTGPATARMVADLILGRPAGIPAALDPARFGSPA